MMIRTTQLDRATLFALAARASADPRSIEKELRMPGSVRGMAGARVRRILAESGLAAEGGSRGRR